jgi:hypothetical protein
MSDPKHPTRDTRADPTPAKGKKSLTTLGLRQAETGNQQPAAEVPPVGEHVPVKDPERAGTGAGDRGAL